VGIDEYARFRLFGVGRLNQAVIDYPRSSTGADAPG
jgi:hypothetical protein